MCIFASISPRFMGIPNSSLSFRAARYGLPLALAQTPTVPNTPAGTTVGCGLATFPEIPPARSPAIRAGARGGRQPAARPQGVGTARSSLLPLHRPFARWRFSRAVSAASRSRQFGSPDGRLQRFQPGCDLPPAAFRRARTDMGGLGITIAGEPFEPPALLLPTPAILGLRACSCGARRRELRLERGLGAGAKSSWQHKKPWP